MPMGVYFPLDICEGISAHVLSSGFLGDTYKKGKKIEICIFHYIIFSPVHLRRGNDKMPLVRT